MTSYNYYVSSACYSSVAAWAATQAYTAGAIVRQLAAPSVGNERCFQASAATAIEGKATAIFTALSSGSVSITTATAGDIIVLVVFAERTNAQGSYTTVSSVSGGPGGWARRSQAQSHNGTDPYNNLEVWWAYASGTLSGASITVNMSATVDNAALLIFGVKNPASTSSPWDANGSLPASSNSSAAPTPGITVSTTSGTNLLLEFYGSSSGPAAPTLGSAGTTFIANAHNAAGVNWGNAAGAYEYLPTALTSATLQWGNTTLTQTLFTVDAIPLASAPSAGTSGGSEPAWTTTVGGSTTDSGVTWFEVTGQEAWQHQGATNTWTAPFDRLATAFSQTAVAGDTIFVGDNHAETQSTAMTITAPGTNASPNFIYCMDHTAAIPPGTSNLLTSATITDTVSAGNQITVLGSAYYWGITFVANGSSTTGTTVWVGGTNGCWQRFESCALQHTASNTSNMQIGHVNLTARVDLVNTTLQFGTTGDILVASGYVTWRNTASAITGSTFPTTFLEGIGSSGGMFVMEGVDLSALGSGKTITASNATGGSMPTYLIDCKINASVTIAATPSNVWSSRVDAIRCDSGATNYHQRRYWYEGTLQEETTIVRTGGATDGTTPISWKIVTTANSKWVMPFEAFPISIWNSRTSASLTVTVYGIWGGGAVPNNDDIWFVVEYLGSTGAPLASFATTTKSNNLATGTALASDTSTWGGSTTKFKMAVTFTPQLTGYLRVYVKAAKASSTFYIDPLPVLS